MSTEWQVHQWSSGKFRSAALFPHRGQIHLNPQKCWWHVRLPDNPFQGKIYPTSSYVSNPSEQVFFHRQEETVVYQESVLIIVDGFLTDAHPDVRHGTSIDCHLMSEHFSGLDLPILEMYFDDRFLPNSWQGFHSVFRCSIHEIWTALFHNFALIDFCILQSVFYPSAGLFSHLIKRTYSRHRGIWKRELFHRGSLSSFENFLTLLKRH